jgi:hypothetical protein
MPVTAKLSRRFYEQFGDELTNELVEWFNSVDASYQFDLRELNEVNFARFDAKLEQRIAGLDARLTGKIDGVEAKLTGKIDGVEAQLNGKIDGVEAKLNAKIDQRSAEIREALTTQIAASESRMIRWMVTLWTGTMVTLVGLLFAVLRSK